MNSRQDRALAAQRHNARLDAPKVEPLFVWLAALCKWRNPRQVRPHRTGGSRIGAVNVGAVGHIDHGGPHE